MTSTSRLRPRAIAIAVALAATACGGAAQDTGATSAPVSAPSTPADTPTTPSQTPTASATPTTSEAAPTTQEIDYPDGIDPARIVIPSIDVDADIVDLQLSGEQPEVPQDFAQTGWYEQTRLPGEIGPAIIAGHVDSKSGPAVFYDLNLLETGDRIEVHGPDGETREFEVTDKGQYDKYELPPRVFGFGEPIPELRLITCGGSFDHSVGHYEDNLVVYARLVGDA